MKEADFGDGLRGHMQMTTLGLLFLITQDLLHFSDIATNEIFHYRAIVVEKSISTLEQNIDDP